MSLTSIQNQKPVKLAVVLACYLTINLFQDNSTNASLVGATLETLLRFLNWIPLGYIFETKLISTLIFKFLTVPLFRNVTLKCLTEIAGVTVTHYDDMFVVLYTQTMSQLELVSEYLLIK